MGDGGLDETIKRLRICGWLNEAELLEELRAAREELAELRELAAGSYTVGWTWRDGEVVPDDYVLTDEDGDPVDLEVDASGLVRAVLERQARIWVRAAEETPAVPLEQLLAMVPERYALAIRQTDTGHLAWWHLGQAGILAEGSGRDLPSAIRAATLALLRVERRCETCAHWGTEEESGRVRSCRRHPLLYARTADSSCLNSGDWEPLAPEPGDGEGGQ